MKTVIEMAREAGLCTWLKPPEYFVERIEAFAELVREDERNRTWTQEHWTEYERSIAAVEREACAKVADTISDKYGWGHYGNEVDTADEIATAIRARGQA